MVYSAKRGHVLFWMWSFMVMQSCMCGARSGSPQPVYMSYMALYNHWTGLVDLTGAPEWWTDATNNSYDPQSNLLTHRGAWCMSTKNTAFSFYTDHLWYQTANFSMTIANKLPRLNVKICKAACWRFAHCCTLKHNSAIMYNDNWTVSLQTACKDHF